MDRPKIYHYHPITKEFLSVGFAKKSPLDDEWLTPAHATQIEPIPQEEGKRTLFIDGEWINVIIQENVEIENEITPEELINLERTGILRELAALDMKLTRSSEDLTNILLTQGIVIEEDIPHVINTKNQKEELRAKLRALDAEVSS